MNENLEYVKALARFPLALRRFAGCRLTLEEAKRIVLRRMETREERFLDIVERSIYGHSTSPYLPLLRMAGCELGDIQDMVKRQGLEGTLRALREAGVFVAFEEFKGRRPIVRNGLEIPVTRWAFENPLARSHFVFQSGGSTGAASDARANLDHIAARAPHQLVTLAAHGIVDAPTAIWRGMLPCGTHGSMLLRAHIDRMPDRWFSEVGWRDARSWPKWDAATIYIIFWMRLFGLRVPFPRVVKVDQALVVARWVAQTLEEHGTCLLNTHVSRGVRVCLAAREAGLDLRGATFMGGGEPATPAKVQQFERAGVRYISHYAMSEASSVASGCAHPADGSDVHLFSDAFALFAYPYRVEGAKVTVPAFNLTTLLPAAHKLMLNVQMDDYGIVEERRCGCELETYGYTTHLRQIRSYSKLTGEGVTMVGMEMMRILGEVLPAHFGGSPLDYQMLEEEDQQGFTRLYLVVSPRVEIADESEVIAVLLKALSESSGMADTARTVWQQAQTIRVKRMEPVWTGRGKLMPLHIQRNPLVPHPVEVVSR